DGDVDGAVVGGWEEQPQGAGVAVAEGGAGPAGEDRREPAAAVAQGLVADRVDAAVDPVEAPGLPALRDGRTPQPSARELGRGYEPVLASGEVPDPTIDRNGAFVRHTRRKAPTAPDLA